MTEPSKTPEGHQTPRTPEELKIAHLSAKENAAIGKVVMMLSVIGILIGLAGWAFSGYVLWIVIPACAFLIGLAGFIYGKVMQDTYKEF